MRNGQSPGLNPITHEKYWEVVGPPGLSSNDVGKGSLHMQLSRSNALTVPERKWEVASKPHKTKPPQRVAIILVPCDGEARDMSVALNKEIIVMPRSYNATQST
jgi:hypothetical protein